MGPKRNTLLLRFILLIQCFLFSLSINGQGGVKGRVVDHLGEKLSFTSIVVISINHGIASNTEGEYSISLPPGTYKLLFQYLGYSPLESIVHVGQGYTVLNVVLQPEVVALPEATIAGKGEDPANTIIRRAIAKAKYHSMQVDEYNAMVYVKGSGRLIKVPGLFKKKIIKALAEEGIDSTVAFTQESVSKLHYIRPDQYRDTVISIRTSGEDNNTSPMQFIYSSFYEPKVVSGISPLAPDAFNHYRYEYLGFIEDGDHVVNKINVIPKGKGDQVFEGVIYIVDELWSIHSLDLTTYIWGIRFDMQQQFSPVVNDVWLPVHEIYDVSGSVFGFGFEYRYFARLDDYVIKLNPDLEVPILVLDEMVESEKAKIEENNIGEKSFSDPKLGLDPGEELSAKQLRKMLREYEKEEIALLPEVDTIPLSKSQRQVIDSSAYERDSSYWEEVRPMPLTDHEIRGYARQDSIAAIPPEPGDEDEEPQDSVSLMMSDEGFAATVKRREKFSLLHVLTGGRYQLSDHLFLQVKAPLQSINYNTVDGFHAGYEVLIGNRVDKKLNWEIGPSFRFNQARETFNYEGKARFFGNKWEVEITGGKQTQQYNYSFPMSPWENSLYSLLTNRNYLKEYEQTFLKIGYDQTIIRGMGLNMSAEYADRKRLVNSTDFIFIDDKDLLFTSNDPSHLVDGSEIFNDHTAIITDASIWFKPFWEYKVSQGTKRKDYSRSPVLTLQYRKGWGESNHPFDLIAANFTHKLPVGAGSVLSMNVSAGKFIGDQKPVYFHDFAHFQGNRLIATPLNPVSSFRLLDYYLYSTNDKYASGLFNYQFRRFALTQFEFFRKQGIRENIIFNTLLTPQSNQYAEIGYGINYILRVMRIEFVTSWQDFRYQNFAVRFGVATDFQSIFGF